MELVCKAYKLRGVIVFCLYKNGKHSFSGFVLNEGNDKYKKGEFRGDWYQDDYWKEVKLKKTPKLLFTSRDGFPIYEGCNFYDTMFCTNPTIGIYRAEYMDIATWNEYWLKNNTFISKENAIEYLMKCFKKNIKCENSINH